MAENVKNNKSTKKRLWRCIALPLCVVTAFALSSCGGSGGGAAEPEEAVGTADAEIIECVADNMSLLAAVPRPSHHEEKISEYFVNWAKEQGLSPVQDETLNVIFDVPATEGMEDYPLGILQGHMDMVVAVEDGKDFDPLNDTITIVRDDENNTLTADGTSLGSDDGAGCAIIMAVVQGKMSHGPLRVIITVDEEDGMDGAFNLDSAYLADAAYLINIDNEASNEVLVSTAAGDSVRITGTPARCAPSGDTAVTVQLSGLCGGHSGMEIDKGRLNGIIGLAGFLKYLDENGISCELASFEGGTALNAIPTKASCTVVINGADLEALQTAADAYFGGLKEEYAGIEDAMSYSISEAEAPASVLAADDKNNAVRMATGIINGVYTMSADMEGLVESSSNLGLFSISEEGLSGGTYIRSSVGALESEILDSQLSLAASCGYEAESVKMADPWPYDPDSRLLALTKEIYLTQNGEEINVVALHAGLECGTFKLLNPELDMISIGPDISDAHTINETLYLDSVPKIWRLLEGLLVKVGEA